MIRRFQIEDIVSQDEHGVVFQAEDTETGRQVAVRRIFPFGVDGGGLKGELATAYEIGIQRFSKLGHAGLRTVVGGGCDPVDGMPFLATEWVEGPTLARALAHGPIAAASVVALMDRALEVCEALSEALAEESVWVETAPAAIIVSAEDAERGFTFWVAPLSWLNEAEGRRGLMPLVRLFKEVTARLSPADSPRVITELKRWGAWLEANAATATLAQARKVLNDSLSAPAPAATAMPAPVAAPPQAAVARAATPQPQPHATQYAGVVKPPGVISATATQVMPVQPVQVTAAPQVKKKSRFMPFVTVVVVIVCLTGAGFQYWRYRQAHKPAAATNGEVGFSTELDAAIRRAIGAGKPGAPAVTPAPAPAPTPAPTPAPPKPVTPPPPPVAKPVPAPVPPKPALPVIATVIPPKHPILGTWKYPFEGVAYTRTFTTEKGVSYMQMTVAGKPALKLRVTQVYPNDVVVKDDKAGDLHHVISKDGKTLYIENKYQATR